MIASILDLPKERMSLSDLAVERYPDNIIPTLFSDFIGAFMDTAHGEILLREVLAKLSEDTDTNLRLLCSSFEEGGREGS